MALQQLKVFSASTWCGSLRSYPGLWQRVVEKKLNHSYTLDSVTQHKILIVSVCPNQIKGRRQFTVSIHDLHVYLRISTIIIAEVSQQKIHSKLHAS